MNNSHRLLLVALLALIFTALFLEQSLGLNLFLFTCLLVASNWLNTSKSARSRLQYISMFGTLLTAAAYLYNHSTYALSMTIISGLCLAGLSSFPAARSVLTGLRQGLRNLLYGPIHMLGLCLDRLGELRGVGQVVKKSYLIFVPLVIIALFTAIYRASNQLFDDSVQKAALSISDFFSWFSTHLSSETIFLFIIGLIIGSLFLFARVSVRTQTFEAAKQEYLGRKRQSINKRWFSHSLSLMDEYKSGLFLMMVLNLLLAVLNFFDIKLIWLNFKWSGEYLKPMLHEGTYLLIMSILISMAVLLFLFRGNLNFLQKNKTLKTLSYVWIGQNAFLALSVLMRTYHYVQYFNLAYRRIALVFFVLLCLYGLYLILKKIQGKRSLYFIVKRMSMAAFITLIITSIPDWDRLIARYNLAHHETAFVHFDYLSGFSNSALPLMNLPFDDFLEMRQAQEKSFSSNTSSKSPFSLRSYMSATDFYDHIYDRISDFNDYYEDLSWLEWNYADYRAYIELTTLEADAQALGQLAQ